MMTFTKSQLSAPLACAAIKDVRYYLEGVFLEVTRTGDVHLVGTNGACLFAGLIAAPNVQWTDTPQAGPWQMIIPSATVKAAIKECKGIVELRALPDGRYTIGSQVFSPVDGSYPDWRRITPSAAILDARGEKPAQFDPDLLVKCRDALKYWHQGGPKFAAHLHAHGTQAAVMTGADMTGFCVVMPWRTNDDTVRPFTPAGYGA